MSLKNVLCEKLFRKLTINWLRKLFCQDDGEIAPKMLFFMGRYIKKIPKSDGILCHILGIFFGRSRADSNRCSSFCRAEPSHSATGPITFVY